MAATQVQTETVTPFVNKTAAADKASEDAMIAKVFDILAKRCKDYGPELDPESARKYLQLRAQDLDHEEFSVMFLNIQNQMIDCVTMFRGDYMHVETSPREIARAALQRNAAGIVISHNHPTGLIMPSEPDKKMTWTLSETLKTVGVSLLDHVITGPGAEAYSFYKNNVPLSVPQLGGFGGMFGGPRFVDFPSDFEKGEIGRKLIDEYMRGKKH